MVKNNTGKSIMRTRTMKHMNGKICTLIFYRLEDFDILELYINKILDDTPTINKSQPDWK